MHTMHRALLIFLGAGCGGVLRHLVASAVRHAPPGDDRGFPAGTLVVNATGCLAMGLLATLLMGDGKDGWRLLLLVGLLGGYTTYSSFGRETVALFTAGRPGAASLYILATNALAIGGVWLGTRLAAAAAPSLPPR
jgi:CrcB protein